jgi:elongation factor Ts
VDALKSTDLGGRTAEQAVTEAIARIGENMTIRRMASLTGDTVVSYVHNAAGEGLGKIGVLVALTGTDTGLGRQIAMHVAAANPAALDEAALDPAIVAKERQVQFDIARESGKPENVIEKMLEGRMKKFMAESTLLGQAFVVNPDQTVAQAAQDAGIRVTGFVRLAVGEGIDKVQEDFAAEVTKMNQPTA